MIAVAAWARPLLRIPLAWKLAGANMVIALIAVGLAALQQLWSSAIMGIAVGAALTLNFALVHVALRPLWLLEATVQRVARGDFNSRVPSSPLADRDMSRVTAMINMLLETVNTDRQRMRHLTSQLIDEGDRQRAAVAHELHDSAAQTLSALSMEIAAAAREESNPEMIVRLETLRNMVVGVTEEIRLLAHEIHPRVLQDLGLRAALRELARESGDFSTAIIQVFAPWDAPPIPLAIAKPLYWVAREALTNAVRYANPCQVNIHLVTTEEHVTLVIEDDGVGFDVAGAEERQDGTGLFSMRERMSLAGGSVEILSALGRGTTVLLRVPLIASSEFVLAGSVS